MTQLFYDHLVKLDKLGEQLSALKVTEKELAEIEEQIDALIQHRVVEVILDLLHEDHHHIFVAKLEETPHDPELLGWLKGYVEDIEERIRGAIEELEEELIEEISS